MSAVGKCATERANHFLAQRLPLGFRAVMKKRDTAREMVEDEKRFGRSVVKDGETTIERGAGGREDADDAELHGPAAAIFS